MEKICVGKKWQIWGLIIHTLWCSHAGEDKAAETFLSMWQHWPGPSNRATILLTKRAIRLINQFNPSNKLTKDQLHPPKIIPPTKYDYSWSTFTTSCDLQIIIILHMWQFSVCDKNVNACGLVGLSLPTETTCNEFPKKTSEEILYWEQIHTQTLHSFLEEFVFFSQIKWRALNFCF